MIHKYMVSSHFLCVVYIGAVFYSVPPLSWHVMWYHEFVMCCSVAVCCLHPSCPAFLLYLSTPSLLVLLPPRSPPSPISWHHVCAAPWWLPDGFVLWPNQVESRCAVVWEHKGMSSRDTAAINSEVSFCKRARCVWGVWCRVCSKQDGISLPSTPPPSCVSFCFWKKALLT